jgi:glucose/arabinose dehydrogenase
LIIGSISLLLSACGDAAKLPDQAGIGPNPTIPPPNTTLIPTINIAAAKGWPEGTQPTPASDLAVNAYATGLDHPRWLYVLPNGDVLVAETNGPPRPEDAKGISGFFFHMAQKWAGAGVPSANRITLLRDADGGAFVGQHGSWNRKPRSGYKVIFVPFANGRPAGQPLDVLTGFINADDEALGRPVGVAIDRAGGLLVADDVGNAIWRVAPAPAKAAMGNCRLV